VTDFTEHLSTPAIAVAATATPSNNINGLSVGGYAVLMDEGARFESLINGSLGGDVFYRRQPVPNRVIDRRSATVPSIGSSGLPLPQDVEQPRPPLRLNQLYWPNGATRWSELFVAMDFATLYPLLREAWTDVNFFPVTEWQRQPYYHAKPVNVAWCYPPLDLAADPQYPRNAYYAQTQLYIESVYPVTYSNESSDIFLVRLVDVRFYWQSIGFGCPPAGRPSATAAPDPYLRLPYRGKKDAPLILTWNNLFDQLAADLNCSISYVTHSWWAKPSPDEFNRPGENAAHMLDAAAISLGSRVTRLLDGVLRLTYVEDAQAQMLANNQRIYRTQGDCNSMSPPGFDYLMVMYPRTVTGHVITHRERYYWQLLAYNPKLNSLTTLSVVTPVDELDHLWDDDEWIEKAFGVPGNCHVVYSSMHAWFSKNESTVPENIDNLRNMTRAIYYDAAGWNYRQWEGDWESAVARPFVPIGNTDHAILDLGTEGAPQTLLAQVSHRITPPKHVEQPEEPPELLTIRERRVTTRFVCGRYPPTRVSLCFDDTVPIVIEPHFKIKTDGSFDVLRPGSQGKADYVVYDTNTFAWVSADPVLEDVFVYDPRYLAFALVGEVVRVIWSDERARWEIETPQGLQRKAVVRKVGGIAAGAKGYCEIYSKDLATGIQVEAELMWMDQGQSISYDKEIHVLYDSSERRWWIPGAECQGGSSTSSH
jgi:hypothetical protein